MPKRRASYTATYKLQAVQKAKILGNRAVPQELGIDEKSIQQWQKDKTILEKRPKCKRSRRRKGAQWPDLEEKLHKWIDSERSESKPISTTIIRMKAKSFAAELNLEEFNGSASWCNRFMKRKGLSNRIRTTISQDLPKDLEEKIAILKNYMEKIIKEHKFMPESIVNMDKVSMAFDIPPSRTVNIIEVFSYFLSFSL